MRLGRFGLAAGLALLAGPAAAAGPPADLCRELAAFLKPPGPQETGTPSPAQATAVQAPAEDKGAAKPAASGGSPQQNSGQSGQVTKPEGDKTAQPASGPKLPADIASEAQAAADAADPRACRAAVQRIRRAGGVAVPPPLLALGALDIRFFEMPR
ncbi:hypothetical protein [Methylobacterium sp. A54F]